MKAPNGIIPKINISTRSPRSSTVNLYKGVDVLKYLRFYEKYPQIEYLMKAGLGGYAFSKQILQEIGKNKRFAKWLMKNRAELSRNDYNVDVIKTSFRTGRPLSELQNIRKNQQALKKVVGISELRTFFKNDLEKFVAYLAIQKTSVYSYNDYFRACNYLGLNMTEDKNRYPHDFKRWHDIRIDEYKTAKAMKDAEERKALYEKFAAVASKYLGLEYDKKSVYIAVIAQNPSALSAKASYFITAWDVWVTTKNSQEKNRLYSLSARRSNPTFLSLRLSIRRNKNEFFNVTATTTPNPITA